MTISKVIEALEEAQEKYGDIEVKTFDWNANEIDVEIHYEGCANTLYMGEYY